MPSQTLNAFQPTYSNSTYPSNHDSLNPMIPNPIPLIPTNNMSNVNPTPLVPSFNTNPVAPLNPMSQVTSPPAYTSSQGLASQPPVESAQSALNFYSAPAGWNDPPVLNKAPKTQVSIYFLDFPN